MCVLHIHVYTLALYAQIGFIMLFVIMILVIDNGTV